MCPGEKCVVPNITFFFFLPPPSVYDYFKIWAINNFSVLPIFTDKYLIASIEIFEVIESRGLEICEAARRSFGDVLYSVLY